MRSHLVLLAGLLLSSCLPTEGQTAAPQIVQALPASSLNTILFRAPRVRLSLAVLPNPLPEKPFLHPAFLLAAAYKPEPSRESRLPIEEFRAPFLTESSFLIAHLWRGLQLDVVDSTLHSQSLQLGPRSDGGYQNSRPSSHDQAGITSSVELDGIGLRYNFGRDGKTRNPVRIWRAWLGL